MEGYVPEPSRRPDDLEFWNLYVGALSDKHNLPYSYPEVLSGGTWPVFSMGERYTIKFYPTYGLDGKLGKEGKVAFKEEVTAYDTLQYAPEDVSKAGLIPLLVAQGNFFSEEKPYYLFYIVTEYVTGIPVKQIVATEGKNKLGRDVVGSLAKELGNLVGRLHLLPKDDGLESSSRQWKEFLTFRHNNCYHDLKFKWKSMPSHFLEQLASYLPSDLDAFMRSGSLRFIHCDLIRDNVLLSPGMEDNGRWKISGLIDFGDARFGDPFYELAALHTNLFQCDKELLAQFVLGYGEGVAWLNKRNSKQEGEAAEDQCKGFLRPDFVYRAMVFLLLYEFNQFENLSKKRGIFVKFPHLKELGTLDELAQHLWDISAWVPGTA